MKPRLALLGLLALLPTAALAAPPPHGFTGDGSPVPAASSAGALQAENDRLKTQVATLQALVRALVAQRDQNADSAAQVAAQAELQAAELRAQVVAHVAKK